MEGNPPPKQPHKVLWYLPPFLGIPPFLWGLVDLKLPPLRRWGEAMEANKRRKVAPWPTLKVDVKGQMG